MKKHYLFLDDSPERHEIFQKKFSSQDVIIHSVFTLDQFLDVLEDSSIDHFDMISLDHDLNDFDSKSVSYDGQEATGLDACGFLVNERFASKMPNKIIIHSVNPCGAVNMKKFLENHDFIVEWIPFCE